MRMINIFLCERGPASQIIVPLNDKTQQSKKREEQKEQQRSMFNIQTVVAPCSL